MKKLIGFIVACVMSCSLINTAIADADITADTISDWAVEYITDAREHDIIASDNDNFTVPITREEFCQIAFNTACARGRSITTSADAPEASFIDTDDYKVGVLYTAGIIQGKSDTEFAPDDFLTREEAATIVVRMVNTLMPMAATEMWFEYADINDISDWALNSVQMISNLGFMQGVEDNKFAPKMTYTKEQAITTLIRLDRATGKTNVYETPLGAIETDTDCNSHINFAIECDARVMLVKDSVHSYTEKTVKALTNQTTSMLIKFDDFADLFGGEWTLNNGVFEFTYDPETQISVYPADEISDGTGGDWPNKTDAVNAVLFLNMPSIKINGDDMQIKAQYGGRVFQSYITLYNEELYVPVHMIAELMDYETAVLQVIL